MNDRQTRSHEGADTVHVTVSQQSIISSSSSTNYSAMTTTTTTTTTGLLTTELSLRPPLAMIMNSDDDDIFYLFLVRLYLSCDILRVSCDTRFTALVLMHRYYAQIKKKSKKGKICIDVENYCEKIGDDHWRWTAGACLFLACKAEEEHRRLRDIINIIHMMMMMTTTQNSNLTKSSNNREVTISVDVNPPPLDDDYWTCKRRLVQEEQRVLRFLQFDVLVSHPHRAVLWILDDQQQALFTSDEEANSKSKATATNKKGDGMYDDQNQNDESNDESQQPPSHKEIARIAFRRLNDALFSKKALQHPTMVLACAAIELALLELDNVDDTNASACTETTSHCYLKGFQSSSESLRWHERYDGVSMASLQACKVDLLNASSPSSSLTVNS